MQSNSTDLFGHSEPPTKFCKSCKRHLPFEAFYLMRDARSQHKRPYRQAQCKECVQKKCGEWYRSPAGRSFSRNSKLRITFGLTLAKYEAMLAAQGGVCFICHQQETRVMYGKVCPLAVDHNHATGEIRRLLCHACNKGLGFFRDDPKLLRLAAEYLESF